MRAYLLGETTGALVGGATMFVLVQTSGVLGLAIGKGFFYIVASNFKYYCSQIRSWPHCLEDLHHWVNDYSGCFNDLSSGTPLIWLTDLILFLLLPLFSLRFARLSKVDLQFMSIRLLVLEPRKATLWRLLMTDK
jgi:hypothetical protein